MNERPNGLELSPSANGVRKRVENLPYVRGFLIGAALLLWYGVVTRIRISNFGVEDAWGLASRLPYVFWLGLALLAASVIIQILQDRIIYCLALAEIVTLILFLFVTPLLIEANPRFYDAYSHMGLARATLLHSQFPLPAPDPGPNVTANPYVSYPGSFLLTAALALTTDLHLFPLMRYFVVLEVGLMVMAIYVLAGFWKDSRVAYMAAVGYVAVNWYAEFHYSPQAFVLPMFAFLVIILHRWQLGDRLLAVLLSVVVIISHPGTTVVILLVLGIYAIYSWLAKGRSNLPRGFLGHPGFLYVFVTLFLVYHLFYPHSSLRVFVRSAVEFLENLLYLAPSAEAVPRLAGRATLESQLVFRTRQATSSIMLASAFWAFLSYRNRNPKLAAANSFLIVGSLAFSVVLIFFFGLVLERGLLFAAFPAIGMAAAVGFRQRGRVVYATGLAAAILLAPVTYYGNEYVEYVTDSDLGMIRYMKDNFHGKAVRANLFGLYSYWDQDLRERGIAVGWLPWYDPDDPDRYEADMVLFSEGEYLDRNLRTVGPESMSLRDQYFNELHLRGFSLVWSDSHNFIFLRS